MATPCMKKKKKKMRLDSVVADIQQTRCKHVCSECDKVYKYMDDLVRHVRVQHTGERPFVCEYCGLKFALNKELRKHSRRIHFHMVKVYVCQHCGKEYRTRVLWEQHVAGHGSRTTTGDDSEAPEFPCTVPQCPRVFSHEHLVKRHVAAEHERGCRASYVCGQCGAGFGQERTLFYHVRAVHQDKRPYACVVCSLTFPTLHKVKAHVRKEHADEAADDRRLRCWKRTDDFESFAARRTDHSAYVCSECGESYRWEASRARHMAKAHPHVPRRPPGRPSYPRNHAPAGAGQVLAAQGRQPGGPAPVVTEGVFVERGMADSDVGEECVVVDELHVVVDGCEMGEGRAMEEGGVVGDRRVVDVGDVVGDSYIVEEGPVAGDEHEVREARAGGDNCAMEEGQVVEDGHVVMEDHNLVEERQHVASGSGSAVVEDGYAIEENRYVVIVNGSHPGDEDPLVEDVVQVVIIDDDDQLQQVVRKGRALKNGERSVRKSRGTVGDAAVG